MKKKNVLFLGLLVMVLAMGMVFVSCDDTGGGTPSGSGSGNGGFTNPFIGTWHAPQANFPDVTLIMTFREDLTVVTNWIGATFTYTFIGNTATLNIVGPNTITISGNSFSWVGTTFVRQ